MTRSEVLPALGQDRAMLDAALAGIPDEALISRPVTGEMRV